MMDPDELRVRFHRSARIRPGKVGDVLKLGNQVIKHLHAEYPQFRANAYTEQFGDVGTVHLFWDLDSMASLEEARAKLLSQGDYMVMAKRASGLFIEGTPRDQLLMSIPRL